MMGPVLTETGASSLMTTPADQPIPSDPSIIRCQNLQRLIHEKQEEIKKLEEAVQTLKAQTHSSELLEPEAVTESESKLAQAQQKLEIAQRELQDLLNDFSLSDCHRVLS